MKRYFSVACSVLLLMVVLSANAEDTRTDAEKAASRKGWDDAWSWGNAFVVKNYVDGLYYPHAAAMLDAETKLKAGAKPADVLPVLKTLPGIKGVVIRYLASKAQEKSEGLQWPDSVVWMDALTSILMNSRQSDRKPTVAPMTHRTVGGAVKYQQVPMGDDFLDLMVRYTYQDSMTYPSGYVALVMDQKWLTDQLPAAMDSLYRENSQLLFCAASPTNKIWEQSLGAVAGTDTLWWVGRKDVKISNSQSLWPFAHVHIYSYVHTLEK